MIEALRRPSKSALLLCIAAVLGTALVLARQATQGVGLHSDSIIFVSVARNLLAGEGFLQFVQDWMPMMAWPPLYPLLLAAPGLLSLDPGAAAGPLNAALFGLCVLVAGLWLRQRLRSKWMILWGCLALMLSLPLTDAASWALSEPLFILLTALSLVQLDRFLENGKRGALAWAAAFAALACLTRYLGVALVVATALLLALQPGVSLRLKAKRIAAFAFVTLTPLFLWMLRNWLISGQPVGFRDGVYYALPKILDGVLHSLILWAYPDASAPSSSSLAQAFMVALWLALALATGYLLLRNRRSWHPFCTWTVFALCYVALLVVAMMAGSIRGGFQPRYLSPVCLPAFLAAAFALDRMLSCKRGSWIPSVLSSRLMALVAAAASGATAHRLLSVTTAAALGGWLAWSAGWQALEVRRAQAGGIHNSIGSQRLGSETFQHLRNRPEAGIVYGNDVYALYLANQAARIHLLEPDWAQTQQQLAELSEPAQIVWFDDWQMNTAFGYNDFDLRFLPGVEVEAELADGAVLRIVPGQPFDAAGYRAAKRRHINQVIAEAGELVADAHFDLRLKGRTLAYVKAPCTETDTKARFFLHVLPEDARDLPVRSRGFENRDFAFHKAGLRFDGKCVVARPLPSYPIAGIRTGQFAHGKKTWQAEVAPFVASRNRPT